jgi:ribosomal protein S18 acetylase RimI-like enzyme
MADEWTIETPAGPRRRDACRLVLAGRCDLQQVSRQGDSLDQLLLLRDPSKTWLRWALPAAGGDPLGACLVLVNPGNVGIALYSSPEATEVNPEALSQAVARASDDALAGGVSLVQSIPREDATADIAILKAAGFRRLAQLQYMHRDLTPGDLPQPQPRSDLTVQPFGEYSEAELAEVIAQTYRDSLDCPGLAELREMDDILEGHRATGIFSPQTWWLVHCEGLPAGCVLVNESISGEAQMVYLGVVPEFRGRGLARWMTAAVMEACLEKGFTSMSLAVDRRNAVARRAYRSVGLRCGEDRDAFIKHLQQ